MAAKLDFERWMQGLGVPMGEAMRATGPIMESRLSERGDAREYRNGNDGDGRQKRYDQLRHKLRASPPSEARAW